MSEQPGATNGFFRGVKFGEFIISVILLTMALIAGWIKMEKTITRMETQIETYQDVNLDMKIMIKDIQTTVKDIQLNQAKEEGRKEAHGR